jgi:predicted RNase H-like nuclease (RuvC/YqgF family)
MKRRKVNYLRINIETYERTLSEYYNRCHKLLPKYLMEVENFEYDLIPITKLEFLKNANIQNSITKWGIEEGDFY